MWEPLAQLISHLVDFLYERGHWQPLLWYGEQLVENAHAIRDASLRIAIFRVLSWLCIERAKYADARSFAESALQACDEIGDDKLRSTLWRYLGATALRQNNFPEAMDFFHRAWDAALNVPDNSDLLAMLENYMGAALMAGSQYEEAEKLFRVSIRRRKAVGDRFGLCVVLRNLGELAYKRGNTDQACRILQGCIRFSRTVPREDIEAGAKLLLAQIESSRGNRQRAIAYAGEARAFYEKREQLADLHLTQDLLTQLTTRK